MSGQSVMDRMQAARHSVLGSQIGKKVCKATTEEILAPKRKHLEDLLQYTHDPNVNVTDIIDQLLSRTHNQNWVVVYKSLITLHHLMCYGHEKVIQNMASRTMELNLANYYDRKDMQGAQMSPFIQRYSKYLSAKAGSYRAIAFDFCNAKRGREEGKLRNMEATELLMALPTLSDQLEALLDFQLAHHEALRVYAARPSDLTNGIVVASFMLLFKDCIRLFASYNEGVINLLEKFFDMASKKQCEQALNAYKKFLQQMENVGKFLKVAEEYGIDKGDIPDLTSAPSSLLDALESHYQSLDSDKKSGVAGKKPAAQGGTGVNKPVGIPKQLSVNAEAFAAVTSQKPQSNNPFFFDETDHSEGLSSIPEADRQKALEEEQKELSKLTSQHKSTNPFSSDVNTNSSSAKNNTSTSNNSKSTAPVLDPFDDLLGGLGSDTSASVTSKTTSSNVFGASSAFSPPANDPFGDSTPSGQGQTGTTFDPFAAFNSQPQQQNMNSNPFLQQNGAPLSSPSAQFVRSGTRQPFYSINHAPQPMPTAAMPHPFYMHGPRAFSAPSQPMFTGSMSANLFANGGSYYQAAPPKQEINFAAAFGGSSSNDSFGGGGSNVFGGMLQPTPIGGSASSTNQRAASGSNSGRMSPMSAPNRPGGSAASIKESSKLGNDLDSALANLATSLNTKSPTHRPTQQQTAR